MTSNFNQLNYLAKKLRRKPRQTNYPMDKSVSGSLLNVSFPKKAYYNLLFTKIKTDLHLKKKKANPFLIFSDYFNLKITV